MFITKSNEKIKSKPKSGSIKTTVTNITTISNLDELKTVVLENPYNVSQASGISEKDWISQQIFALDFDNGITPNEIIKRCKMLSMIPNIIYTTYSDTPELRKFRVLFILDRNIEQYNQARHLQKGLMFLFKEADSACKDLCRMYYPGKEIIYYSEELNETDWFMNFCHGQVASDDRFFEKFSKSENETNTPDKVDNYNWEQSIKELKILDIFFNGENRVSYEILFALMTNAQYIIGGQNKIFERMRELNNLGGGTYFPDTKRGIEIYPPDYFISLSPRALRRYNYLPKSLKNFSPFEEDWDYHNLLEVKFKKGKIERLSEQNVISLNDASELMKEVFQLAKNDIPFEINYSKPNMLTGESVPFVKRINKQLPKNPIYIFKITTGAGKSQAFLNEAESLIALPFHRLKDEMSDRMNVDHFVTPETPLFSDQSLMDTISNLRDSGLYTEVSNIIKSVAKGKLTLNKKSINITNDDKVAANNYLIDNQLCRDTDKTVLTTHTRAVNDLFSFKHDFYIFDEDPLNEIVDIDSIDLDFTAFDGTKHESFVKQIEVYLRSLPMNCVVDIPRWNKPKGFDKFSASIGKGKLIKLLKADYVYKDEHDKSRVNFCLQKSFLEDKKIFIMSATAPIPIYKKLFKDRVIVIDITNIKPMGVIEQWTKRSYSSTGLASYNTKVFEQLYNNLEGTKVITHLKHENKFQNYLRLEDGQRHNFYFGNCSGGDKLNGYDISVVGTPNKPQFVYLFLAELIGLPNSANTELYDKVVEWNDFRFRFFTYDDPTLRDIQLSLIEAELLQAAGRSRFLRNKNTTKIFSSLPLKITTTFYEN